MPAPFDERERDAIRSRLMAAALDALRRGGLDKASVADLAAAASIAKGSFYAFYPSKEHLFMEALESVEDGYRERFAGAAQGEGSPRERLERAFLAAFALVDEEPALRFIDARSTERLARALPPERVAEHAARDGLALERIVADWKREGLLGAGAGVTEVAAAGYVVFLVAVGMGILPEPMKAAARRVVSRGLAAGLAKESA